VKYAALAFAFIFSAASFSYAKEDAPTTPAAHQNTAARTRMPPKRPPLPTDAPAPPENLPPAAAKAPEQPPSPPPSSPAKLDRAEIVKRANAFFNASPVMTADFVQIGGDGKRAEGKLYVQRAGRLRFEYAAPATIEVVSDGAQVLIKDRKLKSQTLYFIDQTPLKFLMKEKIDLEHDVKLVDTAVEDSGVHVLLEDKATFGGESKIQLVFDTKSFKLTQWRITDPQGNETQLSLYNIDQKTTPDPALFKLDAAKND
jgi:outer membrane lipoprotein-sorting protein